MKSYSAETFLEILREIVFTNYLTYTCVNAYSDFVCRFIGVINFMVLEKRIRAQANPKPCFDNEIVSAIQR